MSFVVAIGANLNKRAVGPWQRYALCALMNGILVFLYNKLDIPDVLKSDPESQMLFLGN